MLIDLLLIKVAESPVLVQTVRSVESFQALVGGTFQILGLSSSLMIFCNDNGKIDKLPFNAFGTVVHEHFRPGLIDEGDYLVGDVFLAGSANAEGHTTGVPESAVAEVGRLYKTLSATGFLNLLKPRCVRRT